MLAKMSPKLDRLVVLNRAIEDVYCGISLTERIATHDHDEQDDAERENVNLTADIGLPQNDFGRLVITRAKTSFQLPLAVSALDGAGVAEVCKDELEVLVEKDVLTLEVAVRQPLIVHIV